LSNKYLIAILGPTAIGKTDLCIQLAQHFHTEILSADSRQFYRGMAIGTAQPNPEERQAIKHHFIDFLPIQATYSAGKFEKEALNKLDVLFNNHTHVLLTGGSGLYIKAVCEGLEDMPLVDMNLRQQLNNRIQEAGLANLQQELALRDPVYYKKVDIYNPQRIIRALEVCITTGQPYSSFFTKKLAPRPFKCIKIGLFREREELYKRIDQRVDQMFEQGLLEEATALYAYKDYNALQTVGYQEVFGYLSGNYDQAEAIRLIKKNTRRYAKRQLTWFRKVPDIYWLHPNDFKAIIKYINQHINNT
jgi:tRNA dimethylallyltransferase